MLVFAFQIARPLLGHRVHSFNSVIMLARETALLVGYIMGTNKEKIETRGNHKAKQYLVKGEKIPQPLVPNNPLEVCEAELVEKNTRRQKYKLPPTKGMTLCPTADSGNRIPNSAIISQGNAATV